VCALIVNSIRIYMKSASEGKTKVIVTTMRVFRMLRRGFSEVGSECQMVWYDCKRLKVKTSNNKVDWNFKPCDTGRKINIRHWLSRRKGYLNFGQNTCHTQEHRDFRKLHTCKTDQLGIYRRIWKYLDMYVFQIRMQNSEDRDSMVSCPSLGAYSWLCCPGIC